MATNISHLTSAPDNLWYRIHVFIYDLRHFKDNDAARQRLDSIMDASYIGMPYFTPAEASLITNTFVSASAESTSSSTRDRQISLGQHIEETLNTKLTRRNEKRVDSGDFRVCAAHDLAPIFETVFGISQKMLNKDKVFNALLKKSGLLLKERQMFAGLPKKSFKPGGQVQVEIGGEGIAEASTGGKRKKK